ESWKRGWHRPLRDFAPYLRRRKIRFSIVRSRNLQRRAPCRTLRRWQSNSYHRQLAPQRLARTRREPRAEWPRARIEQLLSSSFVAPFYELAARRWFPTSSSSRAHTVATIMPL